MSSETDHARKMSTSHLPPVIFELPNREDALPIITPHHIALCFLSKGYLSPGLDDAGGTWPQRQALGDALLTAIREADAVREPSIRVLATRLEVRVHHFLFILFQRPFKKKKLKSHNSFNTKKFTADRCYTQSNVH